MIIILCLFAVFQISNASLADVSAGVTLALLRGMELEQSTVFSPFSLEVALGMLNEGATGETKQELIRFLSQGEDATIALSSLSNLSRALSGVETNETGVDIRVANRIFEQGAASSPVNVNGRNQTFAATLRDLYNAGHQLLNFSDGKGSAKVINDFVSTNTKGKISRIVDANSLKGATVVLVNAIYFNGTWAKQFPEENTKEEDFHGLRGMRKEKLMWTKFDYARYNMDHENVKVLSLPYKDSSSSFYVFLPKENVSLTQFRDSLNASTLSKLIENVHEGKVYVNLPRFKIEATSSGTRMLQSAGVQRMFGSYGEFPFVSTNPGFTISDVVHKAFIEVTEKGTVAAAATGIAGGLTARYEEVPHFIADRPFLFAIVSHQRILFLGQFL